MLTKRRSWKALFRGGVACCLLSCALNGCIYIGNRSNLDNDAWWNQGYWQPNSRVYLP